MKYCYAIAFLALFPAITPVLAEEGCKATDKSLWQSPEAAKDAARAHNYTNISKVILEDGCYEVVTINADGKIVGVHFDPVTLELRKIEDPR
jgi:hypothetical protein